MTNITATIVSIRVKTNQWGRTVRSMTVETATGQRLTGNMTAAFVQEIYAKAATPVPMLAVTGKQVTFTATIKDNRFLRATAMAYA